MHRSLTSVVLMSILQQQKGVSWLIVLLSLQAPCLDLLHPQHCELCVKSPVSNQLLSELSKDGRVDEAHPIRKL
ncbi:hypothetical protein SDJN02_09808, partial [Cucurbita argyrosperma subsp. argyrosperma]